MLYIFIAVSVLVLLFLVKEKKGLNRIVILKAYAAIFTVVLIDEMGKDVGQILGLALLSGFIALAIIFIKSDNRENI